MGEMVQKQTVSAEAAGTTWADPVSDDDTRRLLQQIHKLQRQIGDDVDAIKKQTSSSTCVVL